MTSTAAKSPLQRTLQVLGVAAVFAIACVAWAAWNFNRPPFDLRELDRLRPGMSKDEVARLLGKPESDFGNSWAYSRFMAWPIVYVYFDDQGKLLRHEYDH